ncbi:retrovirus-related pol polyprotein from transposon TNT 1-94 [Tanacetum coccineum]
MDLCGPMRVESINGKKYILVIVNHYSRFTWVRFLRSKDEAPDAIIKCIKNIQVRLNATVRNIRTDNGTEFVNQTLRDFYENVGISHQTFLVIPKTVLGFVFDTRKTPYELIHDKKPDLSFFPVFGSLCYPTNDSEHLGKLIAKADISIFVGYAPAKKAFRIYNRRTRKIIETIHVTFDELIAMASEQFGSGPRLQVMTPATSSSGLVPNIIPQQPFNPPKKDDWDTLFQPVRITKSVDTPMVEKNKLDEDLQGTPFDATLYRGMIGFLMYLTSSRPDLIYAVCLCARYQAKPTEKHLNAVKQIFRYLKGTINMGLWCCAQILWMISQLTDYGFTFNKIPLYYDNKSAIALCCNNVQHSRAKHNDVRYHFIKEQVENGIVELYFVWTEYQLADIFTKPLPRERFNFLIKNLGMRSMSPETLKRLTKEEDE